MASLIVAHVRVQGTDVILIVVSSDVGNKSKSEQTKILSSLALAARQAGLRARQP